MKIEPIPEMYARFKKANIKIQEIRGTTIHYRTAKNLFKLMNGGFRITEFKYGDSMSIVTVKYVFMFHPNDGNPNKTYIFQVKDLPKNKLSMQ